MFDPYHKWLGIPPKDQPPNHYRLLGIDLFESDPDVIDATANKQMAYVQGCATGPNLPLSQKLLNEIAAARLCLLDRKRKADYDAKLKAKLGAAVKPGPAPPPKATPVIAVAAKSPLKTAPAHPEAAPVLDSIVRTPNLRRKSRLSPGVVAALVIVPIVIAAAIAVPLLLRGPTENSGDRRGGDPDKVAATNSKKQPKEGEDPETSTPVKKGDKSSETVTPNKTTDKTTEPKEETKTPPPPAKITLSLLVDPPLSELYLGDRFIGVSPNSVRQFSIDLEAGKHELKVMKPGFQTYAQTLDTRDDLPEMTIRLETTRPVEVKAEPKVEPKVVIRMPVPEAEAQAKAAALVRDLFKADYAKAKQPSSKHALALKLMQQGVDAKDDPAGRYMLLAEARDLAAEAGAFGTTLEVIEQLASSYELDALEMKTEALVKAGKVSAAVPTTKAHAASVLAVMNEAIIADDYAAAARLGAVATTAARLANDAASFKHAAARLKELDEIHKAYDATKNARDALEKRRDDPDANLAVGRHACFLKGAWDDGLPHLAAGSDPALKALAEKELAGPAETSDKVALGDAWWEVAQKQTGLAKAVVAHHVRSWYEPNAASLTGLAKTKVDQRLAEIAKLTDGTSFAGQRAVATTARPSTTAAATRPKHIPKDAIPWEGHWYWFSEDKASFDEAVQHAAQLKGRLVAIMTDKENTWITSQVKGATFLGMRKIKGVWLNSLGGRQVYFNWDRDRGQPSGSAGESFAATHTTGLWHDYLSNARLYYCIKWNK